MKAIVLVTVALLGCGFLSVAAEPNLASSVKWLGHFGSSAAAPKSTFCIMARGYFQMSISPEMPRLMEAWLREHPKAIVVPVSSFGPLSDNDPESKMTFVWVVDGEHNLNLELVRQGCFAPETETIGKKQKLEIPQADYDAFLPKLIDAGKEAKEKKLGVWKASSE